jgi:hypothetical protein
MVPMARKDPTRITSASTPVPSKPDTLRVALIIEVLTRFYGGVINMPAMGIPAVSTAAFLPTQPQAGRSSRDYWPNLNSFLRHHVTIEALIALGLLRGDRDSHTAINAARDSSHRPEPQSP